jgi:hypothetical protein
MSSLAATILAHLKSVESERGLRTATKGLAVRVNAVKSYQQRRFSHTYADLLNTPRYGPASRFFLDELYGPNDFTARDDQFARVVPALVRIFPREIVATVAALAHLHALSERLDSVMGRAVDKETIEADDYVSAWLATGRKAERDTQIALTIEVAGRLDRLTRNAVIRNSLRLMRGPARTAGLSALQKFLESGFDTFRAMNGAEEFIAMVEHRERSLAAALFAVKDEPTAQATIQATAMLP